MFHFRRKILQHLQLKIYKLAGLNEPRMLDVKVDQCLFGFVCTVDFLKAVLNKVNLFEFNIIQKCH